MVRASRSISWVKAARRQFEKFPQRARERIAQALMLAAEGRTADIAKPMKGLGPGVFEIALKHRTEAYRTVYGVRIGVSIWVVHAFQKKAKTGIKTPKKEIDIIRQRIRHLREMESSN